MIVLLEALVAMLILCSFMIWRYRATRSILEPGIVFAANLAVLYPIRLVVLFLFNDEALPAYIDVLNAGALERAGFLSIVAITAYCLGYLFLLRGAKVALLDSRSWQVSRSDVTAIWMLLLMSLIGTVYMILTGDYISYLMGQNRNPAFQHIAYLFSTFQWSAFIGVWILYFRVPNAPWVRFTLVLVCLVVIPYQFIQGSKTFLSLLVVSVLFAYVWARRRFPALLGVAGVAFVALFVFPFVHQFRELVNVEYGEIPSISKFELKQLGELDIGDKSDNYEWWTPAMVISGRYAGIDELHNLDQMLPAILNYRYGKDFLAIVYNVVPRMVWPTKPEFSRGADYGAALGTITSVTPFPFGEALWQFGELGLFPLMAIWGAVLAGLVRAVDWFYRHSRNKLFVASIFISQIYWIAGGESSLAAVLSGIPQQIALYGAAYWLFSRFTANRPFQQAAH